MNNDDEFDSEELFDGSIELQRHERGLSFGLDPMAYFRLAPLLQRSARRRDRAVRDLSLPSGQRGCRVVLYRPAPAFYALSARASEAARRSRFSPSAWMAAALLAFPFTRAKTKICECSWSRALRACCEFEASPTSTSIGRRPN